MRKVLIANRGEIAVRVIRTCRSMGLSTVAVYSEVDRKALHVLLADEAHAIGPAAPHSSYLNSDRLLEAARQTGADAVHPGYGFLSENSDFARAVIEAGLIWIGPDPDTIDLMGDKVAARRTATEAGVPPVPGADLTGDPARDLEVARGVGYPIMVKASGGGGGKGMRVVRDEADLESALERARNEAGKAFGNAHIYIERAIESPRHVEVQLVGDGRGRVAVLGERDCSIQRRHQKLVEESTCTALTDAARRELWDRAAALAERVQYLGAGTVEFLLAPSGETFFLEMNTRIQVEHPVTEMVTGVDLVQQQILMARGEPLVLSDRPADLRGHAIECRIGAEDPIHGFLPAAGVITRLGEPAGPGVRVDSGIHEGFEVGLHYDPLLAKLVVWGATRDEAIERMAGALEEYDLAGLPTTLPFHRFAMGNRAFREGRISTDFVGREWKEEAFEAEPADAVAAAVAAVISRELGRKRRTFDPRGASPRWWSRREIWRGR